MFFLIMKINEIREPESAKITTKIFALLSWTHNYLVMRYSYVITKQH